MPQLTWHSSSFQKGKKGPNKIEVKLYFIKMPKKEAKKMNQIIGLKICQKKKPKNEPNSWPKNEPKNEPKK